MSENTLAVTAISDWRMVEGCNDHLSEDQKKAWPVVIETYGSSIGLIFTAPDGTKRDINFEIDEGNLRLIIHRDNDQYEVSVTLGSDGTIVEGSVDSPSFKFDEAGYVGKGKIKPSFG